jgi:hypothetical protein
MTDALADARQRVNRYWNVDGLHEIAIAVLFLGSAAWSWAAEAPPQGMLWRATLSVGFPIFLCGGILLERRAVSAIRQRLTFRRTGFVEFRKPNPRQRLISGLAGMVVAIGLVLLIATRRIDQIDTLLAPGVGLAVGAFLGWLGFAQGPKRLLLAAAASMLTGLGIAHSGMGMNAGLAAYYTVMGAVLLISGALTLFRYLRTAPEPEER